MSDICDQGYDHIEIDCETRRLHRQVKRLTKDVVNLTGELQTLKVRLRIAKQLLRLKGVMPEVDLSDKDSDY